MYNRKWCWTGFVVLLCFVFVALPGDARGGIDLPSPGGFDLVFQCDPNEDPECNLPDDDGGPPCDPETDPECNLPPDPGNSNPSGGEGPGQHNPVDDRDRDGVLDPADDCPDTFGERLSGCPLIDDNPTDEVDGTVILALQAMGMGFDTSSLFIVQQECLVISEVMWAGTSFSQNHQYIEIYNRCDLEVPLDDAKLHIIERRNQTSTIIETVFLNGTMEPFGFYLISNNNLTVLNIRPDLLAPFSLPEFNTVLVLQNGLDLVASTANFNTTGEWYAGARLPNGETLSMERNLQLLDFNDTEDIWYSNNQINRNGLDAVGEPINGTPRSINSPAPGDD